MYNTKSFAICLLVVVCMVKDSSSFCKPFNKTTGMAETCGYSATVNFTHDKHFNSAMTSLKSVSRLLSPCSKYASLIACSVYTPRCEKHIPGPFLPCRRVCDEFNRQCSDQIRKYGMEWIIGMCQLLPEKDDPNTKQGYLGRCFEPPNFKTNLTKSIPVKCSRLVLPICQNLGYTHTVLPESRQKAYASWACRKINAVIDTAECSLPQRRFFCMENFPPCIGNGIGFYCRSKCKNFFKTNCTSPLNYKSDICMEMPEGSHKYDVCKQTHWPRAVNWPHVRDAVQQTTPVDSSITTTPEITQQPRLNTTTKPVVNPNDASAVKGKASKPRKAKIAPLVGGILAGICVIALGLLIAYLIYKNKKRKDTFPRDKQILYNDENVNF